MVKIRKHLSLLLTRPLNVKCAELEKEGILQRYTQYVTVTTHAKMGPLIKRF